MHKTALLAFEAALEQEGILGAVRFLNKRVLHRFTTVYRLDGDTMRSVYVIDKEGGTGLPALHAVPVADSFCQFVIRDGSFITPSSIKDQRLFGHKYQNVVSSYIGLPLYDDAGTLWGTFSHLDVVPRPVNNQEIEFLQSATRLLRHQL